MSLDEQLDNSTPSRITVSETVKQTVISSITNFARTRLNAGDANFQILDLLIPKERKIRSIVGGMETSLGTTLWEPLAKNLAAANHFEVINSNLLKPTLMPASLQNTIQIIIDGRLAKNPGYDAIQCQAQIKSICQPYLSTPVESFRKAPTGFGVDVWLKKNGVDYFFDTKTVQPNIGGYSKYFTQLINWYAYYYSKFPNGNAQARIVFPYNPYESDFWINTVGRGFPLEPHSEAWVEDEFWNFCSGIENTFDLIKSTFVEIAESGVLRERLDELFESES